VGNARPSWGGCAGQLAVGLLLIWLCGNAVAKVRYGVFWERAPATITHASVETTSHRHGYNFHLRRRPVHTTWWARMRYVYVVDGRSYTGNRVRPGGSVGSDTWARRVVRKHPPGTRVRLYYRAENPAQAFLFPAAGWREYVLAAVILWLVLIVAGVVLRAVYLPRRGAVP
jgi:hypothetical protein